MASSRPSTILEQSCNDSIDFYLPKSTVSLSQLQLDSQQYLPENSDRLQISHWTGASSKLTKTFQASIWAFCERCPALISRSTSCMRRQSSFAQQMCFRCMQLPAGGCCKGLVSEVAPVAHGKSNVDNRQFRCRKQEIIRYAREIPIEMKA